MTYEMILFRTSLKKQTHIQYSRYKLYQSHDAYVAIPMLGGAE